jgi:hypothetical protein
MSPRRSTRCLWGLTNRVYSVETILAQSIRQELLMAFLAFAGFTVLPLYVVMTHIPIRGLLLFQPYFA